ncbi:MAG: type IV pilus modification protein PilV [Bacteroidota bacterium]
MRLPNFHSIPIAREKGFSLIEVLVALLVLSIGLLGLAALQTTSLKYNTDSYTRTQATLLAYDIMDRMRSNLTGVSAGNYSVSASTAPSKIAAYNSCKNSASGCGCDLTGANCSTSNLATYDLGKWYERLAATLPEASTNLATISTSSSGSSTQVIITIRWKDRDLLTPKSHTWTAEL